MNKFNPKTGFFYWQDLIDYGQNEAIVLYQFRTWVVMNKAAKRNFHDGRTWVNESLPSLTAQFPGFSYRQIRHVIDKLVKNGVIIKGNYNADNFDTSLWYAFVDEAFIEVLA